jgi:hypothetical protein
LSNIYLSGYNVKGWEEGRGSGMPTRQINKRDGKGVKEIKV